MAYKKKLKKRDDGQIWSSYSDLFTTVAIVFLTLFVFAMIKVGVSTIERIAEKKIHEQELDGILTKKQKETIEARKQKIKETIKETAEYKDIIDAKVKELNEYAKKMEQNEKLMQDLVSDQAKQQSIVEVVSQKLQEKKSELKQAAQNNEQLQKQIKEQQSRSLAQQKEIEKTQEEVELKQAELKKLEELVRQEKQKQTDLQAQLEQQIKEAQTQSQKFQKESQQTKQSLEQVKQQFAAQQKQSQELEQKNKEMSQKLESSSAQLSQAEGKIQGLESELSSSDGQSKELGKSLKEARGKVKALEQKLAGAEGKVKGLEGELGAANGKNKELGDALKDAQGKVKGLQGRLAGAEGKIKGLEGELGAANGKNMELGKALGDALGKAKGLEGELGAAQGKNKSLESQVAQLSGNVKNCEENNQGLQAQLGGLEKEKARCDKTNVALKNNLNNLKSHLGQVADEIQEGKKKLRANIAKQLAREFKQANISAKVDAKTGTVTLLMDKNLLFETNSAKLSENAKKQLARIIPLYSKVLFGDRKVKEKISSFNVEGHASPSYGTTYIDPFKGESGPYNYNLNLSARRAYAIMNYIFSDKLKYDEKYEMRKVSKAVGYGFSRPVLKSESKGLTLATSLDKMLDSLTPTPLAAERLPASNICGKYDCSLSQRVELSFTLKDDPKVLDKILQFKESSYDAN